MKPQALDFLNEIIFSYDSVGGERNLRLQHNILKHLIVVGGFSLLNKDGPTVIVKQEGYVLGVCINTDAKESIEKKARIACDKLLELLRSINLEVKSLNFYDKRPDGLFYMILVSTQLAKAKIENIALSNS